MKLELAEDDRPPAELSLEGYLHSNWRPDCDFVDGRAEERNLGTSAHSRAVTVLILMLADKQEPWSYLALPSLRMRVSPTRVRVPDLCVIQRGGPKEQVLTHPPLAAIDVLDEEDRLCATMEKLADYERFGVGHIWIIDPGAAHCLSICFRRASSGAGWCACRAGNADPRGAQRAVCGVAEVISLAGWVR